MGIGASYRRITAADWENLQSLSEPGNLPVGYDLEEGYLEFAHSDELLSSDRYLSIDKEWHALHVLLTSDFSLPWKGNAPSPPPLGNVVMGGTETAFNATYGKVRFLTPDQVREVADAIKLISVPELSARFDAKAFTEAEVYPNPQPGGWDAGELEPLLFYYAQLVDFFRAAADEGDFVLLSFD